MINWMKLGKVMNCVNDNNIDDDDDDENKDGDDMSNIIIILNKSLIHNVSSGNTSSNWPMFGRQCLRQWWWRMKFHDTDNVGAMPMTTTIKWWLHCDYNNNDDDNGDVIVTVVMRRRWWQWCANDDILTIMTNLMTVVIWWRLWLINNHRHHLRSLYDHWKQHR